LRQLHAYYTSHLRRDVCHETLEHVISPTVQSLEQWHHDLEESREVISRWLRANEESLKRDEQLREVRAKSLFEPVIWIPPTQSESCQLIQAIDRMYGGLHIVVSQ